VQWSSYGGSRLRTDLFPVPAALVGPDRTVREVTEDDLLNNSSVMIPF
jgi:hypothetical protein